VPATGRADGLAVPILAIVTEGGMAAIGPDWYVGDVVLSWAGPAEVHDRLRLLAARTASTASPGTVNVGDLTIEDDTYTARLGGRPLELTYKEFELLKFLRCTPAGCSPGSNCSPTCGATTSSGAAAPWTPTSGGCGPSSDPSTSR
jgi:hypothetical protein